MVSQIESQTISEEKNLQLTKLTLVIVGFFPVLLSLMLVTQDVWGFIGATLAFMSVLTFLTYRLAGSLSAAGKAYGWLLSILMFFSILISFEATLRLAGFQYIPGIQFGFPRPQEFQAFKAHPQLFWTYDPIFPEINNFGFKAEEIEIPRPDDVHTIMFMGDSVTDQGIPVAFEQVMLQSWPNAGEIDAIKIAVPGYTSHQGRILTDLYGDLLAPNVVVVYFGWNDHWRAYGAIDSEKPPVQQSDFEVTYRAVHLWQFIRYAAAARAQSSALDEVRVPLDQYEANLSYIVDFFDERNVPVVMITAPTSYYTVGVPDYIVERNFTDSAEEIIQLHRRYNQVVRAVSEKRDNALLLDLEPQYEQLPNEEVEEIFTADGIHLTPLGLERIATDIADAIMTAGLLNTTP